MLAFMSRSNSSGVNKGFVIAFQSILRVARVSRAGAAAELDELDELELELELELDEGAAGAFFFCVHQPHTILESLARILRPPIKPPDAS